MSIVFVFGSGECEQLGLGDDQPFEIKKPRRIPIFDTGISARRILKIVCGGMHTLALSNVGRVYSWGCNDEGALGREGPENQPLEVKIGLEDGLPITDITAGDSHSIAYNTQINQIYLWGLYRNSKDGRTYPPVKVPSRIGSDLFTQKTNTIIKKVQSGSHHTLVLTTKGTIYGWGDPESGKIGRMLNTRDKNQQALRIEKISAKNVFDIFCGNHHSFYINEKRQVFAWGLNNFGQLGIGHRDNTCVPTKISKLDGLNVLQLDGGEHHSIALTADGSVFCWGKNDEGQCGVGDTFGKYRKMKAQEEYERLMKEEEEKQKQMEQKQEEVKEEEKEEQIVTEKEINREEEMEKELDQNDQLISQENVDGNQNILMNGKAEEKKPEKKRGRKKKIPDQYNVKEEDLVNIFYFSEPVKVEELQGEVRKNITSVYAAGNYCYALESQENGRSNQLYSWGFGNNYVLGNRDEENQFTPYQVHPKMFEEFPPMMVGTGTQHVVVLTTDSVQTHNLPIFSEEVLNFQMSLELEQQIELNQKKRRYQELEKSKHSSHQEEEEESKKNKSDPSSAERQNEAKSTERISRSRNRKQFVQQVQRELRRTPRLVTLQKPMKEIKQRSPQKQLRKARTPLKKKGKTLRVKPKSAQRARTYTKSPQKQRSRSRTQNKRSVSKNRKNKAQSKKKTQRSRSKSVKRQGQRNKKRLRKPNGRSTSKKSKRSPSKKNASLGRKIRVKKNKVGRPKSVKSGKTLGKRSQSKSRNRSKQKR